MNNDYEIDFSINVTDWMKKPDLLPLDDNFNKLLKGFLETPGRVPQPSYNFFVILLVSFIFSQKLVRILIECCRYQIICLITPINHLTRDVIY